MLVILTPLIAAIALRSKFNFFMPMSDKRYTETERATQCSNRSNSSRIREVQPSVHRYNQEIDYTLPLYSEVLPPPAYNKVIYSNRETNTEQMENTSAASTEASLQNRNFTTISNETINEIDMSPIHRGQRRNNSNE
ncbi:hypothetical protein BD408DRAFT_432890 [Parasitella parasitica]|nr:hypothetical protein BD408DRAFT_432890 [Parasitella parasitica]